MIQIGPMVQNEEKSTTNPDEGMSLFIRRAGQILAVSYPTLALATGFRAVYRLCCKPEITYFLPPALSLVAALCYLVATVGFKYRAKWAWQLSVFVLGFETLMTAVVGTLSFILPDLIGHTVWRWYGIDYGFFPLFQPLLGIAWLFHPQILTTYGIQLTKKRIV